ncbi:MULTISPECIES: glutathione S-transferase family protein [unclassified Neptuniibacter]|uniref:glutathione S-transferase family protein n=1 Tax=unclassified Neptuniibacter TaxID=2630693 RepID=UPI000C638ED7|nr:MULTISPECIES: glutathione S-transferase family protein [unclassified Neptuniibacter]MAY41432.1 glutathione S-transferase [Oceanospirillaceae bacterium]
MELIIGNKNYSSWSLRGWLILKAFDLPFSEKKLSLFTESFYQELEQVTPVAKVPVLVDGDIKVWDSLAICEYVNEQYLEGKGWPVDPSQRAVARAVVAEMHSGFSALRNEMPMNCRANRSLELSDGALNDVSRIDKLWQHCLQQRSNNLSSVRQNDSDNHDWLFGQFSIVDVFYAPVALRFQTYGIELSDVSRAYQARVLNHPAIQDWINDALQETEVVAEDEAGVER